MKKLLGFISLLLGLALSGYVVIELWFIIQFMIYIFLAIVFIFMGIDLLIESNKEDSSWKI